MAVKKGKEPLQNIESDKVFQLLKRLNNPESHWKFWVDKKNFGDISGLVPVERLIERERGGIFSPFIDKIKDKCFKFVVIDIIEDDTKELNGKINENDIKRKKIYSEKGIIYFKNNNIDFLYEEVKKIS